jgi:hypothetical protein
LVLGVGGLMLKHHVILFSPGILEESSMLPRRCQQFLTLGNTTLDTLLGFGLSAAQAGMRGILWLRCCFIFGSFVQDKLGARDADKPKNQINFFWQSIP